MADNLRAGSFNDALAADTMASAIGRAMEEEWQQAKGQSLGELGREDRQILFAAIAKGVLRYLYAHRADLVTTNVQDDTDGHVHEAAFGLVETP